MILHFILFLHYTDLTQIQVWACAKPVRQACKMAAFRAVFAVLCLVFIQVSANPLTFYKNSFGPCPGNTHTCTSSETCCPVGDGKYGCCPRVDATCCSDMKHCCPQHYTCEASKCVSALGTVLHPLVEIAGQPQKENIICPDGKHECPTGNTCCLVGCCPRPNAVCCSDMKHCCPSGYRCVSSSRKCEKATSGSSHPMLEIAGQPQKENIDCPDGKHECPTGDTCCPTSASEDGCCPRPNAVCCSDMKHCCPSGYTCVSSNGKCEKASSHHPLTRVEQASRLEKKQSVMCPDKTVTCPDGDTCCPMGDGKDGCCPAKNAVCCPDNTHCCREKHTCGTNGKCSMSDSSHPMLELSVSRDTPVVCPNLKDTCSAGSTCCQLGTSTTYGCCPKEHAVCCSSGKYCCPTGYTCSEKDRICKSSLGEALPFLNLAM